MIHFTIFFLFLFGIYFLLTRINAKYPKTFAIIISIVLLVVMQKLFLKNSDDGYSGDLVPIQKEIDSIYRYENAVKLILNNAVELDSEKIRCKKNFEETGKPCTNYYTQSLIYRKLDKSGIRFSNFELKSDKKDTTITFSNRADSYLRGNHKDEEAGYTLFEHSIIYSTKPLKEYRIEDNDNDTPSALIKIKPRYYYEIYSRLEY